MLIGEKGTDYAVLDRTQVKSTDKNVGLYDPYNRNIQYALEQKKPARGTR